MTTYDFKPSREFAWFLGLTAAVSVLQVLINFDPSKVADWKFWAVSLGAGAVRAVAGGALAWIASKKV